MGSRKKSIGVARVVGVWLISVAVGGVACFDTGAETMEVCPPDRLEQYVGQIERLLRDESRGSIEWRSAFFEALPDDFACYAELFGPSGTRPLGQAEPEMSSLLVELSEVVPEQVYLGKLIRIGVGRKWDSDNITALYVELERSILTRTDGVARVLQDLRAMEEQGFWQFIFATHPHPRNVKLPAEIREALCNASAQSCSLIDRIYAEAVAAKGVH